MRDDEPLAQQTERLVVKQPKKAPKTTEFVDSDDSDDEEPQKAPKTLDEEALVQRIQN